MDDTIDKTIGTVSDYRLLKASGRYYRQNYRYGIGLPIAEEATTNTTDCTSKNPIPTLSILASHGMIHPTLQTTIWANFEWALPILGLHFGIDTLGQDETLKT